MRYCTPLRKPIKGEEDLGIDSAAPRALNTASMPQLERRIGSLLVQEENGILSVSDAAAACVATLGASMSKRLRALLADAHDGDLSPADYNCLGTAAYLLGHTDRLAWRETMAKFGTDVSHDPEAPIRGGDALFQIVGNVSECDPGGGRRRWKTDIVLHAGLLLRNLRNGEPAALEKDGQLPLSLRPWTKTLGDYFPGKPHRYGTALRLLPLDEIPGEPGR